MKMINIDMERLDEKWVTVFKYVYFFIVFFDFVVAPAIYMHLQFLHPGQMVEDAYQSITFGGGGMFHVVALAIIGKSMSE